MLNISGRDSGDIYGIQKEEFNQTYAPCDKEGNILPKKEGNSLKAVLKKSANYPKPESEMIPGQNWPEINKMLHASTEPKVSQEVLEKIDESTKKYNNLDFLKNKINER